MARRSSAAVPASSRRAPAALAWWRPALVVIACLIVYANSLALPLVFDDRVTILENPQIQRAWTLDVFRPARELPVAGRPLANLTFAWNYAAGGTAVEGYHLVNLALHSSCALLLLGVVRRTLRLPRLAAWQPLAADVATATALLWAVHPLNSEVVNYLTQRTESLMALALLGTLYASIRSHSATSPRRWQAAAVLACVAGMAAKETMVVAPVLVVLYDAIFVDGSLSGALRARGRFYAALCAAWLLLAALLASDPRGASAGFSSGVSASQYLLNQAPVIVHYLRLTAWPTALVAHYGMPVSLSLTDVLLPGLLVTSLVTVTAVALYRWPPAGYLGAWLWLTLAPTSSLVPIATEVGAERRIYLGTMALIAGVSAVAVRLRVPSGAEASGTADDTGTRSGTVLAGMLAVAVVLGGMTVGRNREYQSGLALAQTSLARWPSATARLMVGTELVAAGRHDEALPYLREAVEQLPRGRYNLGVELFNTGDLDGARRELQRFVQEQPALLEVVPARALIGRTFAAQGQWQAAIAEFDAVVRMAPTNANGRDLLVSALGNHGAELVQAGEMDAALASFRRAAELAPASATAQRNLATALFDARNADGAVEAASRALALAPLDAGAHHVLGKALAVKGDLARAEAELARAVELAPTEPEFRDDLARLRTLLGH